MTGAPCDACGVLGIQITQMPLPAPNMPAPTVGVAATPSLWKTRTARLPFERRNGKNGAGCDGDSLFSPIFGQHYSPMLSMLRHDPCGDWGGGKTKEKSEMLIGGCVV